MAQAEVVERGRSGRSERSVTIVARGDLPQNVVPLRLQTGRAELQLGIFIQYTIVEFPDEPARLQFRAMESSYIYEVMNRNGHELFAYHWHPKGLSPIKAPHLHVTGASPFVLSPTPGRQETISIPVGKAHFPTGPISLQSIIRLLIEDFSVQSARPDWRAILHPDR